MARFNVSLPQKVKDRFMNYLRSRELTGSSVIRRLIEDFLNKEKLRERIIKKSEVK